MKKGNKNERHKSSFYGEKDSKNFRKTPTLIWQKLATSDVLSA